MVSLPVRPLRRALHNETNICSKSAQVRVNCTQFNNDTSCIGGAVVIILLIRLWRSWQDADKAAEPPKPNTPQIIWMVEVSRLINTMLPSFLSRHSSLPCGAKRLEPIATVFVMLFLADHRDYITSAAAVT